MADRNALPASGYQGTHDPGQPTNLAQPQVNPTNQMGGQAAGNSAPPAGSNRGGSGASAGKSSGSS
jgi:hypothetical protein